MTALTPEISVIVPVYNAEKYLSCCINSILAQSFTNFELLLIDDGSTDKSSEICDDYAAKDQRIKVFHKKNGGVSSARNVGLDHATGKWITFIDSDDRIYEDIFNLISSSYDEDLVIFNYDIYHNGTIQCGKNIPSSYNSYPIKTLLDKYLSIELLRTPWSKFFKRDLINTLRFDNKIKIGEDTLFILQYLRKCGCFFVSEQKYYLWSKENTPLTDKYKLSVEQAVYIMTRIYSEYRSLDIKCIEFEKFIYWFYHSLCEDDLYKNGTVWFTSKAITQLWHDIKFSYSRRTRISFYLKKKYRFITYLLRLFRQVPLYLK